MPAPSDFRYTLEFEVRDYECDLQGIVNNAVYLNYLEHTRHMFLRSEGIDFAALAASGVNLVVLHLEIDYRRSLRSGDRFFVSVDLERVSPLRMAFVQHIFRLPDLEHVVHARTVGTGIDGRGRPAVPQAIFMLLEE